MPVYQGVPGAAWDGAARGLPNAPNPVTVNKHVGMPSNAYVTSSHALQPWRDGEQDLLREGQILFSGRSVSATGSDKLAKMVSMQHLNRICAQGYKRARQALESGQLPEGINISAVEFDGLREREIFEFLGKEHLIPPGDRVLLAACKLLKITHFKYLVPAGVMYHWSLFGAVNNMSKGNSPEAKTNRNGADTVVVNAVVAKKVAISNNFGDARKVVEGSKIGLVMTRRMGANGTPLQTVIEPWALRDYETPPFSDRGYYDARGDFQMGFFLPIGTCYEIEGKAPPQNRIRESTGTGEYTRTVIHDALGSLPKMFVLWGV